uniref:VLIG-type G domain-containing protein n=1 Tax=Acanthochromis polyacanthus TaxID=80966 RepID=A0A3Q1EX60_9TELE
TQYSFLYQCQKKAKEFTDQCLKPAVEDFVYSSLGPNIIDEMLTCEEFSTRMSFQYSLLKDLLSKKNHKDYLRYSSSYESYVKERIHQQIKERFSSSSATFEFEDRHLQSSISSINDAIKKAKTGNSDNLKKFVEDICKELGDKLVISQDALGAFMILNKADPEPFAHWLTESVKDMKETLREKFKKTAFAEKLKHVHMKPQNELFTRVIGCGKQCPFCKVPCDAGGNKHTQHFASLHRPQGLGTWRWTSTNKLTTDICSSLVDSDKRFRCDAANNKSHPYKSYRDIYPDWDICPDVSLQASDYWKYVMATYNEDFAEAYDAEPADIPETWKQITDQQAEASLKESFSIK